MEQSAIVRYLDKATAEVDSVAMLVTPDSHQIQLATGIDRTRLIADLVTGKLDVREAAEDLDGSHRYTGMAEPDLAELDATHEA